MSVFLQESQQFLKSPISEFSPKPRGRVRIFKVRAPMGSGKVILLATSRHGAKLHGTSLVRPEWTTSIETRCPDCQREADRAVRAQAMTRIHLALLANGKLKRRTPTQVMELVVRESKQEVANDLKEFAGRICDYANPECVACGGYGSLRKGKADPRTPWRGVVIHADPKCCTRPRFGDTVALDPETPTYEGVWIRNPYLNSHFVWAGLRREDHVAFYADGAPFALPWDNEYECRLVILPEERLGTFYGNYVDSGEYTVGEAGNVG